jgi:Protein of unknown function (DUF3551)
MRTIPLVAITLAALSLSTIGAHAGSWCAHLAVPPGAESCSFYSLQQCQATVSGIGGFCTPNAFSYGSASSAYGYARGPRRHYRHR